MKYNELTYHKASPYYLQDFLPDCAWINRKPKEYPSQIPTGQEYYTYSGRKHFTNRLNRSEIEDANLLKSPQRYPFQHQIAMAKDYKRNLDTIDIQGASSGTRVTIGVKNRLRGQEEIARRHNYSVDMNQHKELSYEQKRRQIATKQYENVLQRKQKQHQQQANTIDNENSRVNYNFNPQTLQPRYQDNYGKKYAHLVPKHNSYKEQRQTPSSNGKNIEQFTVYQPVGQEYKEEIKEIDFHSVNDNRQYNQAKKYAQNRQRYDQNKHNQQLRQAQQPQNYASLETSQQFQHYQPTRYQYAPNHQQNINTNNRFKSNPVYVNTYDIQLQRRKEEQNKINAIDEIARNKLQDKKGFRQNNPTNLSLSLAAQSIVNGPL